MGTVGAGGLCAEGNPVRRAELGPVLIVCDCAVRPTVGIAHVGVGGLSHFFLGYFILFLFLCL